MLRPSSLSQQLAVLRRAGLVASSRDGALVMYALSTPDVADLLAAGRQILGRCWLTATGCWCSCRPTGSTGDGRRVRSAAARLTGLLPQRSDWDAVRRAPCRSGCGAHGGGGGAAAGVGVRGHLRARAQAGLVTAVVAGAVAAVFGGSNLQVSGPTGAMTVVLVPVVAQFGAAGVLMVGVMAGVVLLGLAVARLGRYVRYLPTPVIEGFTAGIAVVIALQQVPAALGVTDAHGDKVWAVAGDALARFARIRTPRPSRWPLASRR